MLWMAAIMTVGKRSSERLSHLQQAAKTQQANVEGYNQQQIADGVLPAVANHQGISVVHMLRVHQLTTAQTESREAMAGRVLTSS